MNKNINIDKVIMKIFCKKKKKLRVIVKVLMLFLKILLFEMRAILVVYSLINKRVLKSFVYQHIKTEL